MTQPGKAGIDDRRLMIDDLWMSLRLVIFMVVFYN
jgi:hypothetical protein